MKMKFEWNVAITMDFCSNQAINVNNLEYSFEMYSFISKLIMGILWVVNFG